MTTRGDAVTDSETRARLQCRQPRLPPEHLRICLFSLRGFLHSTNSHPRARITKPDPAYSMDSRSGNDVHGRAWIAWVAASVACILTAAFAVTLLVGGVGEVNTKPSAEIYFENPSNIAAWTGTRLVSFSFVVRNLASDNYRYQYVIRVAGQEKLNKFVASKAVTLEPHQLITIRQTLKSPNSARFQISVSLVGAKNIIFFWTQAPKPHDVRSRK